MNADFQIVTALPCLPPRRPDSNKGNFGRVLVIAGSRGMAGAGVLSASAALRGGAGLVQLAVPVELLPSVAIANPCVMTAGLPHDEHGRFSLNAFAPALALAEAADAIALGPGLGRGDELPIFVRELLAKSDKPIVLDADGLNNIADDPSCLGQRNAPTILTPHPGEFGRLVKQTAAGVQADRRRLAARFAREHSVVVVLKGLGTIVTDGAHLFVNDTGNPGMATAGSGDVLTGVIAALLGQGLAPFEAAQLGVHWHGLAGDLAAKELGQTSLIATDLIDYLPQATQQ